MTDLNLGEQPAINWPALDAELRAALPGKLYGTSYDKHSVLTVHVVDGLDAEALRPAIAAALKAHDPSVLTPAQQADAERAAALNQLAAADFAGMVQAVEGAATLEDVRPLLLNALGALQALTLALGLKTNSETNS